MIYLSTHTLDIQNPPIIIAKNIKKSHEKGTNKSNTGNKEHE
jgi:hypothetical protein